jgi:hypothetical protein
VPTVVTANSTSLRSDRGCVQGWEDGRLESLTTRKTRNKNNNHLGKIAVSTSFNSLYCLGHHSLFLPDEFGLERRDNYGNASGPPHTCKETAPEEALNAR